MILNCSLKKDLIEILVSKLFKLIILFLLCTSCSLDNRSGIWKNESNTTVKVKSKKNIFQEKKISIKEFNKNIKISLKNERTKETSLINTNNIKIIKEIEELNKVSKYNFSKIKRFEEFEPELVSHRDKIFFFDNKGALLKLNKDLKLIWKKNSYSKIEKKLNPIIYMTVSNKTLFIADTISKLYAVDIDTGQIIWTKYNESPFSSKPKIYKDKIYVLDSQNKINCFSIVDGKKIWTVGTENPFINSASKQSIVIKGNNIFFNNSLGDITALNINTGVVVWQVSTQKSKLYENIVKFKTSSLVISDNSILFSNNKNGFYSIDLKTGQVNWRQKINTIITPVLVGNLIITITQKGYLFYIDHNTGNIIKIINTGEQLVNKLKKNIDITGFSMTYKNLYLTTSNGRLVEYSIGSDNIESISKIDNKRISKPFILDENLFIVKDSSIIKFN